MKNTLMSMKVLIGLAVVAFFVSNLPVHGAEATNIPAEDEAAIREHVKQMEAGWNKKQGALFAKPFAEDADYVIINGMYIQGRTAIEKGHQQIFDTFYKNTTISLSVGRFDSCGLTSLSSMFQGSWLLGRMRINP